MIYTHTAAVFSDCGAYRYRLDRRWKDGPTALWIGLNPSIADLEVDDPTVRKEVGYSDRWGCGALIKCNLAALISTDPKGLRAFVEIVGRPNDGHIIAAAKEADLIVAAWGEPGLLLHRSFAVLDLLPDRPIWCVGHTKAGAPRHPSRAPYIDAPIMFREARAA